MKFLYGPQIYKVEKYREVVAATGHFACCLVQWFEACEAEEVNAVLQSTEMTRTQTFQCVKCGTSKDNA